MALESSSPRDACSAPATDGGSLDFDDGVVYPVSDDMGDSGLQITVNVTLWLLLRDYFKKAGRPVLVGTDQFFYYERGNPRAVVAPDVYVIEDETEPLISVRSWKVWEHGGKVPSLALEVVSDEHRKDYEGRFLDRYEQLGVAELIRYDPEHGGRARRQPFSHFVRDAAGRLVELPAPRDRVRCVGYDFWLVQQPDLTLRIAVGPDGDALWPTEAERAAAEAQRAAAEAQRAAAEAQRADAAEAEILRLRAELDRLQRG